MANTIEEQKLIDTQTRALLKYVVVSDGTQETDTRLIDASNLAYSLNANGLIMQSNTHPKSLYRTTIRRIFGHGQIASGHAKFQWQGDANDSIVTIGSGSFDIDMDKGGNGGVLTNPQISTNATGDILVTTLGLQANDAFTVIFDLRKDNQDYDAGQTADPVAFNRGPGAAF